MEKIELGTPDGAVENIEKIARLFPQVVTEVENTDGELARAVDFDALPIFWVMWLRGSANVISSLGLVSARPRPRRAALSTKR